jgi:hypothetical protein
MAVSYLSKVYESNPYVIPMDLGLLMKVNQYKQSQFYQNAERINSQFDQLNSLDIANPYQKQHTEDVINNLSAQIQNMGGLDYSDPNIANTISGYASSVYQDPAIINGILSTKAIRTYDKNTQDMKTNPKLAQYYDPAREIYDKYNVDNPNSQINYLKGDINAKYEGPTAPAPYLGNDFDLLSKELEKIHPNIQMRYGPSGNRFFIDMTTNKTVDPYTIRKMIDGRIDGKVADQLNVHAWYNYDYLKGGKYTKEDGISEYNAYYTNQLNKVNSDIETTKKMIATEPDNFKRADLETHLKQLQETELPEVQKAIKKGSDDFSSLWDNSKGAALYNLYTNKLKDDISTAFSYNEEQHKLIVNQEEIANARLDLEAAKAGYKLERNADGTVKLTKIPKPGMLPGDNLLGQLTRDFSSEEDLKKLGVSSSSVHQDIENIQNQMNAGLRSVMFETALQTGVQGLFPEGTNAYSVNDNPNANPVSRTDLLRQVAQLAGDNTQLTKEDIDRVLQNVDKAGTFDANGNFSFKAGEGAKQTYYNEKTGKQTVSLTAPQISYFKKVQTIMDDAANGKDITGVIGNAAAWRKYMNNYSINNNIIAAKKQLLDIATNTALGEIASDKHLTSSELAGVKDYLANPSKYEAAGGSYGLLTSSNPGFNTKQVSAGSPLIPINPIYKDVSNGLKKLGGTNVVKDKLNDVLNRTADRKNYYSVALPDSTDDLQNQYRMTNLKNYILNDESVKVDVKNFKDVHPVAIVTDGEKFFVKTNDASDLSKPFTYIPITEENLEKFGLGSVPYPQLEQAVSNLGHLPEPIFIDPLATNNEFNRNNGFNGPLKIDIINMNSSGDRNSNTFTPAIIYKGKNYLYTAGNSKSANAALELITNAIQNNQDFPSLDQTTYTLKDGKTYTADQLKALYNVSADEINTYISTGQIIPHLSLLDAIQKRNNQ